MTKKKSREEEFFETEQKAKYFMNEAFLELKKYQKAKGLKKIKLAISTTKKLNIANEFVEKILDLKKSMEAILH